MSEHPETRNLLGPYVMGALGEQEERMVEEHLEGCEDCREEEQDLRLAHDHLADLAYATEKPPPGLKDRVVAGMPHRAQRRRVPPWAAVAAALCVLALLGVVFASGLSGLFAPEIAATTLRPTELAPGAGGELRIESTSANTRAELEVWDLPPLEEGEYYELWFGKENGRVSAGTFTVDEGGSVTCYVTVPAETVGGYERVGITRERFPVEPRMDRARVVLGGELREI
ncbi:MAG: anti-sigma factor [Actinomycetota bacterium]|nr:anti-sigma factor [Actinomycetota bacterium]